MLKIARRSFDSLRSDRTRLSVAIAFAAVGLLFSARLIVIQDMPRTAVAEPEAATAPQAAQQELPQEEDPDEESAEDEASK